MRFRKIFALVIFFALLFLGPFTTPSAIRIGYLVIIPIIVYLILGWLWKLFKPSEIFNYNITRILFGVISLYFLFLTINELMSDTHIGNTEYKMVKYGMEEVGEDVILKGPDWFLVLIWSLCSFAAFKVGVLNDSYLIKSAEECRINGLREPNNREAISYFTNAIELYPKSPDYYFCRGRAKFNLKDFSNSIDDFNKAIKIDPNYEEAYNYRGFAKHNLKDYTGAITDYSKAIEINSNDDNMYYNRGNAKFNINDLNGACADWAKSGELGSNNFSKFCKIESENTLKNDFIEKKPKKEKEFENNDDKNKKETSQQRKTLSLNQLSELLLIKQKAEKELKMLDLEEEKLKKRRIIRHTQGRNRSKYR